MENMIEWFVPMEDTNVHTVDHPFCDDLFCPCHADINLILEYLQRPVQEGLLVGLEVERLYMGEQLGGKQ